MAVTLERSVWKVPRAPARPPPPPDRFCSAPAAIAGVGGTMWCIFQEQVYPEIGLENIIFAMIVVIIGGLGSVTGSFLGAIIVGLSFNYVSFLLPKVALGVNILIMAIILLIRPWGLMGKE